MSTRLLVPFGIFACFHCSVGRIGFDFWLILILLLTGRDKKYGGEEN